MVTMYMLYAHRKSPPKDLFGQIVASVILDAYILSPIFI